MTYGKCYHNREQHKNPCSPCPHFSRCNLAHNSVFCRMKRDFEHVENIKACMSCGEVKVFYSKL